MQCARDLEFDPELPAAFVELADVKSFIGITSETHDALLTSLIDAATQTIEQYCARKLAARTVTENIHTEDANRSFILGAAPIAEFTSLTFKNAVIEPEEMHIAKASGVLRKIDSTSFAPGHYEAVYVIGYAPEDLPEPIKQAAKECVREHFELSKRNVGVSRESVPDVADVTYASNPFPVTSNGAAVSVATANLLAPYVQRYSII